MRGEGRGGEGRGEGGRGEIGADYRVGFMILIVHTAMLRFSLY